MFVKILMNIMIYMLKVFETQNCLFLYYRVLAWQASLRNTIVRVHILTDIDILLTVEKGVWQIIFHDIHQYAKANNRYMKY